MNAFATTDVGIERNVNQDYVYAKLDDIGCLPNPMQKDLWSKNLRRKALLIKLMIDLRQRQKKFIAFSWYSIAVI